MVASVAPQPLDRTALGQILIPLLGISISIALFLWAFRAHVATRKSQ
jgi:hypothetical protein